jgi:hypothetical protein
LGHYNIFGQGDGERSVFLFLRPERHGDLIHWSTWKAEQAHREMVVPFLEAGYSDFVSTEEIDEVLFLHIPLSPAIRAAVDRISGLMNATADSARGVPASSRQPQSALDPKKRAAIRRPNI